MKRALWLAVTFVLVACGGSPAVPTLDVTSRDATSIAWQIATIEARDAMASLTETSAPPSASGPADTATPSPQPTATPQQPTATPSEPFARLRPDYDQANVRNGPGTDYTILGQLQRDVTARITGRNDDGSWWQIVYNNSAGWVSGQLVETLGNTAIVRPQQVAPAPTVTPDLHPHVLVKTGYDYVNVRNGPAHSYDVIGRLQPNTPARVIGRNADSTWWQIDYEGSPRWIDGNFVDPRGATSAVTVAVVAAVPAQPASTTAPAQPTPAPAAAVQAAAPAPAAAAAVAVPQASDGCPSTSTAGFELLGRDGPASNRPDRQHGDLNLGLRGYSPADAPANLMSYSGPADGNAPQFAGMFQPNRFATIQSVYRVNLWYFESDRCNSAPPWGCAGPAVTNWPVTLIGLATAPGERISIPSRGPDIGSGYQALVLYADTTRITLSYTRQDNISFGYAVYIENVCVDPNLLALYRAQNTADGWRSSALLPALRSGQPLGSAFGNEIRVAIRDSATFMDPRSRKDWWQR